MGSKGLNLFGQTNLNEVAPQNRLAYAQTGSAAYRPLNGIDGHRRRQRGPLGAQPQLDLSLACRPRSSSRFGQGSQVSLAYTWSKLLANTGVANADGPGLSNNNAYTDSTQPNLDRSRGGNDVTHVLQREPHPGASQARGQVAHSRGTSSATGSSPASSGRPPVIRSPWSRAASTELAGNGNAPSGSGNGNNLTRPNVVDGRRLPRQRLGQDRSGSTRPPGPSTGTCIGSNGNAGRNTCNGPGSFQTDASLYKNIKLGERVKLQLRFEVFNVFNTVNFLGSEPDQRRRLQRVQPAERRAQRCRDPDHQRGRPWATSGSSPLRRDPRTMQLGIRLAF